MNPEVSSRSDRHPERHSDLRRGAAVGVDAVESGGGRAREDTRRRQSAMQRHELALWVQLEARPGVGPTAHPSPVGPAETLSAEPQAGGVRDGDRPALELLRDFLETRHASSLP